MWQDLNVCLLGIIESAASQYCMFVVEGWVRGESKVNYRVMIGGLVSASKFN